VLTHWSPSRSKPARSPSFRTISGTPRRAPGPGDSARLRHRPTLLRDRTGQRGCLAGRDHHLRPRASALAQTTKEL